MEDLVVSSRQIEETPSVRSHAREWKRKWQKMQHARTSCAIGNFFFR